MEVGTKKHERSEVGGEIMWEGVNKEGKENQFPFYPFRACAPP